MGHFWVWVKLQRKFKISPKQSLTAPSFLRSWWENEKKKEQESILSLLFLFTLSCKKFWTMLKFFVLCSVKKIRWISLCKNHFCKGSWLKKKLSYDAQTNLWKASSSWLLNNLLKWNWENVSRLEIDLLFYELKFNRRLLEFWKWHPITKIGSEIKKKS